MSTLAQWAAWQPGLPLPVGPVEDIQTQWSVGGTTVPFNSPGVTSEMLRAVVEAPGYVAPTVPFLNQIYDPGPPPPPFMAPPEVFVPPYIPPVVPPTTWYEPEIPQPPPRWVDLPPLPPPFMETPRTWYDPAPLPPPEEMMPYYLPPSQIFTSSPANISLALQAPSAANMPYALNTGQVAGAIGAAGTFCASLPNAAARYACQAAAAVAQAVANSTGASGGGQMAQNGGGAAMGGTNLASGSTCEPGYIQVAGRCVNPLALPPGGVPFMMAPAQAGYFGALSAAPMQVSQTVLRCPRGLILGKDNRCYARGSIPRNARKWLPEPRPLVSRSDVKALNRIKSIRSRVKKAASSAGLTTTTKGRAAAPGRKRK